VFWAILAIALVVLQCAYKHPFTDPVGFAALLGLMALAGRAILAIWKWADLAWRKLWLWLLNSSVHWTLEARVAVPHAAESADLELLLADLRAALPGHRVSRGSGEASIVVRSATGQTITIRPIEVALRCHWVLAFQPTDIGYRSALRLLRREFVPLLDKISSQIPGATSREYAIDARFPAFSPHASVLLNELRARSADSVLISFMHDGTRVTVTRDRVTCSSGSEAEAIHSISAVFGITLRGAPDASHV
jgi:hypothetical protein